MIDDRKNNKMLCQNVPKTIPPKEGPESSFRIEVHERPLITFALVAYNQERFIKEAVNGAFSQTYSPLEIILSDDCSTDNTFEIMKEMANSYTGPHKVILNRNPHNLGIGAHVNRIMELSRGELIVGAAGDDVSLPERVQENFKAFVNSERMAMSLHSSVMIIDEEGQQLGIKQDFPNGYRMNIEKALKNGSDVWGCAHAWHRKVFHKFGPLRDNVALEDLALAFRSLLLGWIVHIRRPLVLYRLHGRNCSGQRGMVENRLRQFHSQEDFCHWRMLKLKNFLSTRKQYYSDLQKGVDRLDDGRKEKLLKDIGNQIENAEIELLLRSEKRRDQLKEVILRNNANPLRVAKRFSLLFFPKLFVRLSFEKWRLQCLLSHVCSIKDNC